MKKSNKNKLVNFDDEPKNDKQENKHDTSEVSEYDWKKRDYYDNAGFSKTTQDERCSVSNSPFKAMEGNQYDHLKHDSSNITNERSQDSSRNERRGSGNLRNRISCFENQTDSDHYKSVEDFKTAGKSANNFNNFEEEFKREGPRVSVKQYRSQYEDRGVIKPGILKPAKSSGWIDHHNESSHSAQKDAYSSNWDRPTYNKGKHW